MAESNTKPAQVNDVEIDEESKNLQQIFLEGQQLYEEVEKTSLPSNSTELQTKIQECMEKFEQSTRIVSQVGMFSSNEVVDEISTESLQYLLLPFFLGKLALKLNRHDRVEVLNIAEVYLKDYLQRCEEYELCDGPKVVKKLAANNGDGGGLDELAELKRAAHMRNDKIAQFRRKKELEEQVKLLQEAVKNSAVDDEVKRDFFLKFLKKSIIDANEELESLQLEKQMAEMRKMHMSKAENNLESGTMASDSARQPHVHTHGHSHGHQHNHPKPKPLQPFIITRNATQKAVFGMGYPSLPILTVDEFYSQRVHDGIFPDEQKVAQMNQAQAIAAAKDPNEKEDEEKAAEEVQIEADNEEYLARMRGMDEYKDQVRRGDGNRHNRS